MGQRGRKGGELAQEEEVGWLGREKAKNDFPFMNYDSKNLRRNSKRI